MRYTQDEILGRWARCKVIVQRITALVEGGRVDMKNAQRRIDALDQFYLFRADCWMRKEQEPWKGILVECFDMVLRTDQAMFKLENLIPGQPVTAEEPMPETPEESAAAMMAAILEALRE